MILYIGKRRYAVVTKGEDNLDISKRNTIIICATSTALEIAICVIVLCNSEINTDIAFQYLYNFNTGEPLSLIASIFLYLLFWVFFAALAASVMGLVVMLVHGILHIGENTSSDKHFDEEYVGFWATWISTYIVTAIMLILGISNLVTFPFFK